jgi:basic membrane protein A
MLILFFNVSNVKPSINSLTQQKNIAVILPPESDTVSNREEIFRGMIKATADFDVNISFAAPTTLELNDTIESYANDSVTTWDLIIAVGLYTPPGVNKIATTYPNQRFSVIDSVVNLANVSSIVTKEHEGSFLAGAMASMVSTTGVIGFLGGMDITLIHKFLSGYEQGAKWVNPGINVLIDYSPNQTHPWTDIVGGKNVADQFILNNADIIYTAAGQTGLGVFDAVIEARNQNKNVYAIGVDYNQDILAPGMILTSVVKNTDVLLYNEIQSIVQGTWTGGTKELGVAENGIGLTNMDLTSFIRDSPCTSTKTRFEVIEDLKLAIINNSITVNDTLMSPGEFNTISHQCIFSAPEAPFIVTSTETNTLTDTVTTTIPITEMVTTIEQNTVTETETSSVVFSTTTIDLKTSEGFSVVLILSSLLFGVILIFVKRRR